MKKIYLKRNNDGFYFIKEDNSQFFVKGITETTNPDPTPTITPPVTPTIECVTLGCHYAGCCVRISGTPTNYMVFNSGDMPEGPNQIPSVILIPQQWEIWASCGLGNYRNNGSLYTGDDLCDTVPVLLFTEKNTSTGVYGCKDGRIFEESQVNFASMSPGRCSASPCVVGGQFPGAIYWDSGTNGFRSYVDYIAGAATCDGSTECHAGVSDLSIKMTLIYNTGTQDWSVSGKHGVGITWAGYCDDAVTADSGILNATPLFTCRGDSWLCDNFTTEEKLRYDDPKAFCSGSRWKLEFYGDPPNEPSLRQKVFTGTYTDTAINSLVDYTSPGNYNSNKFTILFDASPNPNYIQQLYPLINNVFYDTHTAIETDFNNHTFTTGGNTYLNYSGYYCSPTGSGNPYIVIATGIADISGVCEFVCRNQIKAVSLKNIFSEGPSPSNWVYDPDYGTAFRTGIPNDLETRVSGTLADSIYTAVDIWFDHGCADRVGFGNENLAVVTSFKPSGFIAAGNPLFCQDDTAL